MATTTSMKTVTIVTALVEKMASVSRGTDGASTKDYVSNDAAVGDVVFGTTTMLEKYGCRNAPPSRKNACPLQAPPDL
jgi:hypothetical protein